LNAVNLKYFQTRSKQYCLRMDMFKAASFQWFTRKVLIECYHRHYLHGVLLTGETEYIYDRYLIDELNFTLPCASAAIRLGWDELSFCSLKDPFSPASVLM